MGKRTARTDELEFALSVLREAGVSRSRITFDEHGPTSIEVEFSPPVVPAGLVDRSGKPVSLDEGMGPLEKDPLGGDDEDEAVIEDPIHAKNFPRAGRAPV